MLNGCTYDMCVTSTYDDDANDDDDDGAEKMIRKMQTVMHLDTNLHMKMSIPCQCR